MKNANDNTVWQIKKIVFWHQQDDSHWQQLNQVQKKNPKTLHGTWEMHLGFTLTHPPETDA